MQHRRRDFEYDIASFLFAYIAQKMKAFFGTIYENKDRY